MAELPREVLVSSVWDFPAYCALNVTQVYGELLEGLSPLLAVFYPQEVVKGQAFERQAGCCPGLYEQFQQTRADSYSWVNFERTGTRWTRRPRCQPKTQTCLVLIYCYV